MEVEKVLDYREEDVDEIIDDLRVDKTEPVSTKGGATSSTTENGSPSDGKSSKYSTKYRPFERNSSFTEINDSAEVAETKTQIFQPVERCRKVLEKIWEEPLATGFIDPVDTDTYEDYLEVVGEAISLSEIKEKLEIGEYSKYGQYSKFAQDMRKIWRNCKAYNLYKSQIWLSAHYLSILFERLFQAWIVSFSDGTIPFSEPAAKPWESACRECLIEENEDEMMLCDHCDSAHHIYCLNPPLKKVPEGSWMCSRCTDWLSRSGAKLYTATAEEEVRLLVEGAQQRKVVRIRKKKYLVKWRGLSYKECTWETASDINDDAILAEYHRVNDSPPDEPPLTQAEIGVELAKDRKNQLLPAGMNMGRENPITDLDSQVYAQIRSYHFLRWNKTVPNALLRECGPSSYAYTKGVKYPIALPRYLQEIVEKVEAHEPSPANIDKDILENDETEEKLDSREDTERSDQVEQTKSELDKKSDVVDDDDASTEPLKLDMDYQCVYIDSEVDIVRREVADLLADVVYSTARDFFKAPIPPYPSRPLLPSRYQSPSEIEVCVPKGNRSLGLKVGLFNKSVVVVGFKPIDDKGNKGSVENTYRVKAGDILVAINGLYVHEFKFEDVLQLLKGCNQPFLYLRFLRIPSSIESKEDGYVHKYMLTRPKKSPRVPFPHRSMFFGVFPSLLKDLEWSAEYFQGYEKVYLGDYSSEQEAALAYDAAIKEKCVSENSELCRNFDEDNNLTSLTATLKKIVLIERAANKEAFEAAKTKSMRRIPASLLMSRKKKKQKEGAATDRGDNEEKTKEEQFEGDADENEADDEMDVENEDASPFLIEAPLVKDVPDFHSIDSRDSESDIASLLSVTNESSDDELVRMLEDDVEDHGSDEEEDEDDDDDNQWNSDNSDNDWKPKDKTASQVYEPDGPVGRLLRAVNETDYPPFRSDWVNYVMELAVEKEKEEETAKTVQKSKKIQQIDMVKNEVIRIWDSVNQAARALNIPANEISATLANDFDSAGGFKWQSLLLEEGDELEEEDEVS